MPNIGIANQETLIEVKTTAEAVDASLGKSADAASETGSSLWARFKALVESFKAFIAIWTQAKADNLDAKVSTRADAASLAAAKTVIDATKTGVDTLNTNLTATRAGNLDATISTRAAQSNLGTSTDTASATSTTFWGRFKYFMDNLWTAARAAYLDASISSRAPAADMTATKNLIGIADPTTANMTTVMNALKKANDRIDETFLSASNSRAAVAGAIGSPATSTNKFSELAGRIGTSKTTLAANLTAKGVTAAGTEPLQALAEKVGTIPIGGAGGGYSKIEEVAILASGNYEIPEGVEKIDIALVGGGNSPSSTASNTGASGGKVIRYFDIPVTQLQEFAAVIGATGTTSSTAGGNTTFGSYSSASGTNSGSSSPLRIWDDETSMYVSGSGVGKYISSNSAISDGNEAAARGGGAIVIGSTAGTSALFYIQALANSGGGGARTQQTGSSWTIQSGAQGRIQLRLYYKA